MKSHSQHIVSGAAEEIKVGTPRRGVRATEVIDAQPDASARRPYLKSGRDGVALVITLLMLSVITFLAIAFLSMTQRNRASAGAGLDQTSARTLADAAQARAQAEVMAFILAHGDPYYYDYMVSQAYRGSSNNGPTIGIYDPNNVNYEYFLTKTGGNYNSSAQNGALWAQNIANLYYDPSPPVFIVTNPAASSNSDFRFWVDYNRNGKYETNGYITNILDNSYPAGGNQPSLWAYGEPQWVGILRDPLRPHSSSNQFIGRYAYMVLPIGKTLDLNYIGNYLKGTYVNLNGPTNGPDNEADGYARDQGIGSWELNLAALLDYNSPFAYENASIGSYPDNPQGISTYQPYRYYPPNGGFTVANTGTAFADAQALLSYRYGTRHGDSNYYQFGLANLLREFQSPYYGAASFGNDAIDMYAEGSSLTNYIVGGSNGIVGNFPTQPTGQPWPGSYQTNLFFDLQDLFDPTKNSASFTNRLLMASQRTNSYDRYTFQRLLTTLGTGSTPEYGVWVNNDYFAFTNPPLDLTLRAKVNINFNNSSQVHDPRAPYAPMPNPTNLTSWTPIGFFTNASELLLRSQTYCYSNIIFGTTNINLTNQTIWAQFGLTNIPIYRTNQPGIRYNSSVHRMLQLAANIYDATVSSNYPAQPFTPKGGGSITPPPVRYPSVFRPLFGLGANGTNVGINIIGYAQVTNAYLGQLYNRDFYDLPTAYAKLRAGTVNSNVNIWGIPWIVGAEKGLPQFYQYSYDTAFLFERKLFFSRNAKNGAPNTNNPPAYTNQFYCMTISNNFGLDGWNPYPIPFTGGSLGGTSFYISNFVTITLTNNYRYMTNIYITNVYSPPATANQVYWPGWPGDSNHLTGVTNGILAFINTNFTTLPPCYFSEHDNKLQIFGSSGLAAGTSLAGYLPEDTNQTGWPVHNWTINITNRVVYAMFDGNQQNGVLLDFVNLGPFGTSLNIQETLASGNSTGGVFGMGGTGNSGGNPWTALGATDAPNSPPSQGLLNQIATGKGDAIFQNDINGVLQTSTSGNITRSYNFGCAYEPSNYVVQAPQFVANDPMVHYTIDDLTLPSTPDTTIPSLPPFPIFTNAQWVNALAYHPWGMGDSQVQTNMLFKDSMMVASTNWDFPTGKFPSIGWLGRVHRGTPWQTIYLKADNPTPQGTVATPLAWATKWVNSPWFPPSTYNLGVPPGFESAPESYPTNDWKLLDLFTCAPNDNAMQGLLSVNQTNVAAWAAVYAGVMAPTNGSNGTPILPADVYNLVDATSASYTINAYRTNFTNGIFHHIGEILGATALTTQSPWLISNNISPSTVNDEIVERIPQQTMGLLKLGEPQFVVLSWGQSLKPKGPPYLGNDVNKGIYTNYEITGEFQTRTVCHLVHTNGLKMVVDSFNVENGGN